MACQEQAYQAHLAETNSTSEAFAEFGVATEQAEFEFNTLTIWHEFLPILPLFDYVVLIHNHYNGHVMGVDWVAVDVLLKREDVNINSENFANWRIALIGYVEGVNQYITDTSKK